MNHLFNNISFAGLKPMLLSAGMNDKWTSAHDWLYFISNIVVWAACLIMPIMIIIYVFRKGKDDIFFRKLYLLFAAFLLINGLTYLFDALVVLDSLEGVGVFVRLATGVLSWVIVLYSLKVMATSYSIKTRRELMDDIIRRMQSEYELKLKIERLLESERNVRLGYIYWDLMTDHIEISDMAADVLGIKIKGGSLRYDEVMEQIDPEQMEIVKNFIDKKLLKANVLTSYFRITTLDNEERYVLVKAEVSRNSMGDPVTIKGSIQNVSELRELQKMEEQKRKLKEIAWVQSHRMRSPVATILGMSDLFNYENPADPMNAEVLSHIKELTHKLDDMIREVDALTRVKETEYH